MRTRPIGYHNQLNAYQGPVANGPNVVKDKCSQKPKDIHFSFNDASQSGMVNESALNPPLKPSSSSMLRTGLVERSPERPADFYFGAVEEKAKDDQKRKIDILNYGRAKRDEIIEKL